MSDEAKKPGNAVLNFIKKIIANSLTIAILLYNG